MYRAASSAILSRDSKELLDECTSGRVTTQACNVHIDDIGLLLLLPNQKRAFINAVRGQCDGCRKSLQEYGQRYSAKIHRYTPLQLKPSHLLAIIEVAVLMLPAYLQTSWLRCITHLELTTDQKLLHFIFGAIADQHDSLIDNNGLVDALKIKIQCDSKIVDDDAIVTWIESLNTKFMNRAWSPEQIKHFVEWVQLNNENTHRVPVLDSNASTQQQEEWLLCTDRSHPDYFKCAHQYHLNAYTAFVSLEQRLVMRAEAAKTNQIHKLARSNWELDRSLKKRRRGSTPVLPKPRDCNPTGDLPTSDELEQHNEEEVMYMVVGLIRSRCLLMTFKQGLSSEGSTLFRRAKCAERQQRINKNVNVGRKVPTPPVAGQRDTSNHGLFLDLEQTIRKYNNRLFGLHSHRRSLPIITSWLYKWVTVLNLFTVTKNEIRAAFALRRQQLRDYCTEARNAFIAVETLGFSSLSIEDLTHDWTDQLALMTSEFERWESTWLRASRQRLSLLRCVWAYLQLVLTGCICTKTESFEIDETEALDRETVAGLIDKTWARRLAPAITMSDEHRCGCHNVGESDLRHRTDDVCSRVQAALLDLTSVEPLTGLSFMPDVNATLQKANSRQNTVCDQLNVQMQLLSKGPMDAQHSVEYIQQHRKTGGLICSYCGCGQHDIQMAHTQDYLVYTLPRNIQVIRNLQYPVRMRVTNKVPFKEIHETLELSMWTTVLYVQPGSNLTPGEYERCEWQNRDAHTTDYQSMWVQGYNRVLTVVLRLCVYLRETLMRLTEDFKHTVTLFDAMTVYRHFPSCKAVQLVAKTTVCLLQGVFLDSRYLSQAEAVPLNGTCIGNSEVRSLVASLIRVPLCHFYKGGNLDARNTLQKQCLGNDTNNLARLVITPSRHGDVNRCRLGSDAALDLRVLTIVHTRNLDQCRRMILNFAVMQARYRECTSRHLWIDPVHGRSRPRPAKSQLVLGAVIYTDVYETADQAGSTFRRYRFSQDPNDYRWHDSILSTGWKMVAEVLARLTVGSVLCHPVSNRQAVVFSRSPVLRGSSMPAMQVEVPSVQNLHMHAPLTLCGVPKSAQDISACKQRVQKIPLRVGSRDHPHTNQICPSMCFFSNADFDGDQSTINAGIHPAQRLGALVGAPIADNLASSQSGRALMGLSVVHAATFAILTRVSSNTEPGTAHLGEPLSFGVILDMVCSLSCFDGQSVGTVSRFLSNRASGPPVDPYTTTWFFGHVLQMILPTGFWFAQTPTSGYRDNALVGEVGSAFVLPDHPLSVWSSLRLLYPANTLQVLIDIMAVVNIAHKYCSYPMGLADTLIASTDPSIRSPQRVSYRNGKWQSGMDPSSTGSFAWPQCRNWRRSTSSINADPSVASAAGLWGEWEATRNRAARQAANKRDLLARHIKVSNGHTVSTSVVTYQDISCAQNNSVVAKARKAYEQLLLLQLEAEEDQTKTSLRAHLKLDACDSLGVLSPNEDVRSTLYDTRQANGFGLRFAVESGVKGNLGKLSQVLVSRGACVANWAGHGTLPRTVGCRGAYEQRLFSTDRLYLNPQPFRRRTTIESGMTSDAFVRGLDVRGQTVDAMAGVVPQRTSTSEVYKSGTTTKQLLHICSDVYLGAGKVGSHFKPRRIVTYSFPDHNDESLFECFSSALVSLVWGSGGLRVPLSTMPEWARYGEPRVWNFEIHEVGILKSQCDPNSLIGSFVARVKDWLHPIHRHGERTTRMETQLEFAAHLVTHELYLLSQCSSIDTKGIETAFNPEFIVRNVYSQLSRIETRAALCRHFEATYAYKLLAQNVSACPPGGNFTVEAFYKSLDIAIWQIEMLSTRHLYKQSAQMLPDIPTCKAFSGNLSRQDDPFRCNFWARNWHLVVCVQMAFNPTDHYQHHPLKDYILALVCVIDAYQRSMEEYGSAVGYACATNLQESATQAQLNTRHGTELTDTEQINAMVWNKPKEIHDQMIVLPRSNDTFNALRQRYPDREVCRACLSEVFVLALPPAGLFKQVADHSFVERCRFVGSTIPEARRTSHLFPPVQLNSTLASVVVIDTAACKEHSIPSWDLIERLVSQNSIAFLTTVWENTTDEKIWVVVQHTVYYTHNGVWPVGYQLSPVAFEWYQIRNASLSTMGCEAWLRNLMYLQPVGVTPLPKLTSTDTTFMNECVYTWYTARRQEKGEVSNSTHGGPEQPELATPPFNLPPPLEPVTLPTLENTTVDGTTIFVPEKYTARLDETRDTPYTLQELCQEYPWLFNLIYTRCEDGTIMECSHGVKEWMDSLRRSADEVHDLNAELDVCESRLEWILAQLTLLVQKPCVDVYEIYTGLVSRLQQGGALTGRVAVAVGHHMFRFLHSNHPFAIGFYLSSLGHLPLAMEKIGLSWSRFILNYFEHQLLEVALEKLECKALALCVQSLNGLDTNAILTPVQMQAKWDMVRSMLSRDRRVQAYITDWRYGKYQCDSQDHESTPNQSQKATYDANFFQLFALVMTQQAFTSDYVSLKQVPEYGAHAFSISLHRTVSLCEWSKILLIPELFDCGRVVSLNQITANRLWGVDQGTQNWHTVGLSLRRRLNGLARRPFDYLNAKALFSGKRQLQMKMNGAQLGTVVVGGMSCVGSLGDTKHTDSIDSFMNRFIIGCPSKPAYQPIGTESGLPQTLPTMTLSRRVVAKQIGERINRSELESFGFCVHTAFLSMLKPTQCITNHNERVQVVDFKSIGLSSRTETPSTYW